ncbi:TrmH family RNA methyltransferase [Patescibacteria group bacterium]|nr:TrmH family RNA methyltransferase [Patescibacteria group bacterium]
MNRKIVLLLQNIRSLHNVGSLFRSADVFGVEKVYLCGYTGTPPRKEIAKVALGAEEWIPWEQATRTHVVIERLRREGYQIVALETGIPSTALPTTKFSDKVALIVGNEVAGITAPIVRRADAIVHIPMYGKKESLNVSVAGGVALYALRCC